LGGAARSGRARNRRKAGVESFCHEIREIGWGVGVARSGCGMRRRRRDGAGSHAFVGQRNGNGVSGPVRGHGECKPGAQRIDGQCDAECNRFAAGGERHDSVSWRGEQRERCDQRGHGRGRELLGHDHGQRRHGFEHGEFESDDWRVGGVRERRTWGVQRGYVDVVSAGGMG
jgi:hypothetical protein